MASAQHNLSHYDPHNIPNAESFRFGIVVSTYNDSITSPLLDGCLETLKTHGAADTHISVVYVPGAFELTGAADQLLRQGRVDAVICLGCVIKGDTDHDKYINHAVAQGITQLNIQYGKPVIFGLLTPNTYQQAADRAGGQHGNKGVEAAIAAIQMVALYHSLQS